MIDPKFVDYLNVPYMAATISPFQLIKKVTKQKAVQNLSSLFHFLMPSTGFLTLVLVGCLLYWAFSWLLTRFQKSARSLASRRKRQTKIVSFFFLLFLSFMGQFFGGNLNTSNVVVRTDDLLYSKGQILKTKKEFCFLEKSSEMDFVKNVGASMKVFSY